VVTVLGADGEPFAHIGPEGAEVNKHSPTWLATSQSHGYDLRDLYVDPAAAPSWLQVESRPSLFWLESRGLYGDETLPASIDPAQPTVLTSWSFTVQRDDVSRVVSGVTEWVPATGPGRETSSSSNRFVWIAVVLPPLALAGLVAILVRRGRSSAR
jgi:hypothetical protein